MIIVKIGGSLYDRPDLGMRLATLFNSLDDDVLIVPGGGAAADAVREWDSIHHLGEEASHWLAVQAMDLAGRFLKTIISKNILEVEPFLRAHDDLPHSWSVTSDSIAVHAAIVLKAKTCILLKSIDVDATLSWSEMAAAGYVDEHFPIIAARCPCPIRIIKCG